MIETYGAICNICGGITSHTNEEGNLYCIECKSLNAKLITNVLRDKPPSDGEG